MLDYGRKKSTTAQCVSNTSLSEFSCLMFDLSGSELVSGVTMLQASLHIKAPCTDVASNIPYKNTLYNT